jgi:hypothetical protein
VQARVFPGATVRSGYNCDVDRPTVVIELADHPQFARDISAGGVFVRDCTLPINSECTLLVRGSNGEMELAARVVYVDPKAGAGLELVSFTAAMRDHLTRLMTGWSEPIDLGFDTASLSTPSLPVSAVKHVAQGNLEAARVEAFHARSSLQGGSVPPARSAHFGVAVPPPGGSSAGRDARGGASGNDARDARGNDSGNDARDARGNDSGHDAAARGSDSGHDARGGASGNDARHARGNDSGHAARGSASGNDARDARGNDSDHDAARGSDSGHATRGSDSGLDLRAPRGSDSGHDAVGRDGDAAAGASPTDDETVDDVNADDAAAGASAGDDGGEPPLDEADAADPVRRKHALNLHERLRGLTHAQQIKHAASADPQERVLLERFYNKNVWEPLLRNPRLTPPEVARIARMGTLPRVLIEIIVGNGAWLQVPEIRRALLANPRLGTDQILRVLRMLPKHELKLAATQTSYPFAVRDAARRLLKES